MFFIVQWCEYVHSLKDGMFNSFHFSSHQHIRTIELKNIHYLYNNASFYHRCKDIQARFKAKYTTPTPAHIQGVVATELALNNMMTESNKRMVKTMDSMAQSDVTQMDTTLQQTHVQICSFVKGDDSCIHKVVGSNPAKFTADFTMTRISIVV